MVLIRVAEGTTDIAFAVQCAECSNTLDTYFIGEHEKTLCVPPCPHCLEVQSAMDRRVIY